MNSLTKIGLSALGVFVLFKLLSNHKKRTSCNTCGQPEDVANQPPPYNVNYVGAVEANMAKWDGGNMIAASDNLAKYRNRLPNSSPYAPRGMRWEVPCESATNQAVGYGGTYWDACADCEAKLKVKPKVKTLDIGALY